MTSMTVNYREAAMTVPVSLNRQITHGRVYTAMSDARGARGARDYIYSCTEHSALNGQSLVTIRSENLPAGIPATDHTMIFAVGQTMTCVADLVVTAQVPGQRYKYRVRRADELRGWAEELFHRHGFTVRNAQWGSLRSHIVKKGGFEFSVPSIYFKLNLEVTDPEKASRAWLSGVGRKKGYGFGMLEVLGGK